MAVIGTFADIRAQLATSPAFDVALDYIARVLTPGTEENARAHAMPIGAKEKYELAEGVFSMEQAYLTRLPEHGKWESHQVYADIQVIVSGDEIIEYCEIGKLEIKEDLTPGKDQVVYFPPGLPSRLVAGAGFCAVFLPGDGHCPSLQLDGPAEVRKIVLKVPIV